MIKSTASAGPMELQGSPSAYYLWEFPEKPVSVRLSLDVVDRLERDVLESFRAITARGSEVGGLLLGRSEAGPTVKTIVENYELFHCDYTRGPLYLLSDEEKARLEDIIRRKKAIPGQAGAVVGFFRSNTRKDLALDDEDLEMFRDYFSRPEQAFLLVKPYAAKPSVAGLFIWEDGKVRNEGSYIEFPFRRSELGRGDFAGSIVMDAPKPKEAPAEPVAPAMTTHKTGSRAPVLPFSLKRDEEPPVAAPPLKKEERAPVIALSPKPEEPAPQPAPPKAVEPARAPVEPKPAVVPPVVPKAYDKAPAAPSLRDEKREQKKEAPAAPAKPAAKAAATATSAVAVAARAPEPAPAELFRTVTPPPARSLFGGKKLWALFGGLTMLSLAGGTMYYLHSHSADKSGVSAGDAAGFQLKADRSGAQLLVSWNRQSSVIQAAQSAVLSISDGAKTEEVPLDLTQLHAGRILYSPLSGDVSFRLEVKDGKAGKGRSEFVRAPLDTVAAPAGKDAAKSTSLQAQLTSTAQQQEQQKPSPADPARVDSSTPPTGGEDTAPPERPAAAPPKPFSLAARVRQPEATDLPEAPSVDPSASSLAIRPGAPSRLPAPPPPPPQAQPAQSAPAPAVPATPVRVGGKVQEPKLLRRIDASYPPMARQARVSGVVRIQATIGTDGKVKKLEVRSGPPLLRQSAIDAVQKWIYSPSLLNGSPVEATTEVDVNFNLSAR